MDNYMYGSETSSTVDGDSLTVTGKWYAYQFYTVKPNTDYTISMQKEVIQSAVNNGLIRISFGSNTNNILVIISSNFSF